MKDYSGIRCDGCGRLLFKTTGSVQGCVISIKCPRCGQFNHLRPEQSPLPQRHARLGKEPSHGH